MLLQTFESVMVILTHHLFILLNLGQSDIIHTVPFYKTVYECDMQAIQLLCFCFPLYIAEFSLKDYSETKV